MRCTRRVLQGTTLVPAGQLAMHYEAAGLHAGAAILFKKCAEESRQRTTSLHIYTAVYSPANVMCAEVF